MIAELSGAADAGTEQRIDQSEPVATAVDDDAVDAEGDRADESETATAPDEAAGDVTAESAEDSALDTLRKRRIERLARSATTE